MVRWPSQRDFSCGAAGVHSREAAGALHVTWTPSVRVLRDLFEISACAVIFRLTFIE